MGDSPGCEWRFLSSRSKVVMKKSYEQWIIKVVEGMEPVLMLLSEVREERWWRA